jgi:exodeoxyribonuclease III
MKIISWNVNGIRAIEKKGFAQWLKKTSPDILCLQETKASVEQLSEELVHPLGYTTYWSAAEKKGYSGVSVFTKIHPLNVQEGLGVKVFDVEGRTLCLDYGKFLLFNIYFPNGSRGNVRVPFKMAFYDAFLERVETLHKQNKKIVICGDVNTAHTEIDLARPKENEKTTGFLPEERAWITKFLSLGYVDTFRQFCKDPGHYTWWDYKTKARERDIGWRIDYFFISPNLTKQLKKAFILKEDMGSDHCPIGIELKLID